VLGSVLRGRITGGICLVGLRLTILRIRLRLDAHDLYLCVEGGMLSSSLDYLSQIGRDKSRFA
jgi:hypothetical protein